MASKSKPRRPQLLSSTRPAPTTKPSGALSSRHSRSLIRGHHTLRKNLRVAIAKKDAERARELELRIEEAGGMEQYQQASIQGQSVERGGDSSKVLVEWLEQVRASSLVSEPSDDRPRLLEVGALRADNACAQSKMFEVERIDLRSQHPSIRQQDFMERPVPATEKLPDEGFDILSLSLVLNFVDDAYSRGKMLKRTRPFLRDSYRSSNQYEDIFPSLFLVLPAPCVENSRYLNVPKLENIMEDLGFVLARSKKSSKLVYFLWRYEGSGRSPDGRLKKEEVRSGKTRNNFAIELR